MPSFELNTSFQPSPTIVPFRTITAPNGPPCPNSIPLLESATARFMCVSFIVS